MKKERVNEYRLPKIARRGVPHTPGRTVAAGDAGNASRTYAYQQGLG
jgi:hypothetical protein